MMTQECTCGVPSRQEDKTVEEELEDANAGRRQVVYEQRRKNKAEEEEKKNDDAEDILKEKEKDRDEDVVKAAGSEKVKKDLEKEDI